MTWEKLALKYELVNNYKGENIEVVYPFDDPVGLIMNEEGKLLGLGDFLVTGLIEENFGSLSDELIEKYTKFFYF